jgi:hypothetical protein
MKVPVAKRKNLILILPKNEIKLSEEELQSEVLAEVGYHYSKPSYEYEDNNRTFTREYDMSGILTRVGVRFFFN